MHWTDQERLFYETNGYLVFENVLTPPQLEFLRTLVAEAEERWRREPDLGGERDPHFEQIAGILEYHPGFLDLVLHPEIFPRICDAIGPDVQLLDHACYITRPGGEVKGSAWHTDVGRRIGGVYHPRSTIMVRVLWTLTDVTLESGPTLVLPGSHRFPPDFTIPAVEWPEEMPGAQRIVVPAGSAYFFNGNLWHAPSNNVGKETRRVVLFNYGHRWMRMWQGHEPSEWLQEQATTPMRKQLLGMWRSYYGKDADLEVASEGWLG